ncbi:DNA polymerase III subunit chi [Amaricoccus tamworthensis]|uniref:DNA polymerase III subunit chi n=1 Tax=Amaricoccus tamworthensis TaxID=57002 RepID=UPI003C7BEB8F
MAEVLFYHLTSSPLERNLPGLLEKCLERNLRVVVRMGRDDRVEPIDTLLWSYRADAFLPHGTNAMGHAALQPIYLTSGPENPNRADVLMLVEGARVDAEEAGKFTRTCLMFDGNDPETLNAARADWKAVVAAKIPAKYWAQDGGRWVQKLST